MLEIREETMKEKKETFIYCHSLLHQSLSLLNQLCPNTWSKIKTRYKKREGKVHYSRRNPRLQLSNPRFCFTNADL